MKDKQKKKSKYYYTLKTLPLYKKHYKLITIVLILSLVSSALSILFPIFSAQIVNNIANFHAQEIIKYLLLTLLVTFLLVSVNYTINLVYTKATQKVTLDINAKYLEALTNIRISEYDKNNSGLFTSRFSDVNSVSSFLVKFIDSSTSIIANIAFLFYIMSINVYIGLTFFVGLSILYVLENKRLNYRYKFQRKQRKEWDKLFGESTEVVRGIRDVKALNLKQVASNRINTKRDELLTINYNFQKKYQIIARITSFYRDILNFIIIGLGVLLILNGLMVPGTLLIIFMYYGRALNSIVAMINLKDLANENELSCERIYEILNYINFKPETFGTQELQTVNGKIEFKNVTFNYSADTQLFKNINLTIMPNQITSLVGKSGQGKTTILSLISKLYDVENGEILIDNQPINTLTESAIRNNISYIMQTPYIFNVSIKDNLLLANKNATVQEVIDACKKVELHDFIDSLPNKYDSIIGENGVMFSGGQKQRLAIARALLRKTKIILLDESTSSLDNENQEKIKSTIKTLSKDHTIVIVAHRLTTVIDSDKIIVLDDHKIVDTGKHSALLKNCDIYKNLYKSEN